MLCDEAAVAGWDKDIRRMRGAAFQMEGTTCALGGEEVSVAGMASEGEAMAKAGSGLTDQHLVG